MLKQARCLKIPSKTYALRDMNEYCKYHQHFRHDIDSFEEFHSKVESMMMLGMFIMGGPKENAYNKKVEVCRYQLTKWGPPKMILTKLASITSGSYNALPHNYRYSFHNKNPASIFHVEIKGLTRNGRCFTTEEMKIIRKPKERMR